MDTAELAAIATDHRVRRTFAFIDLCGFTDFVDEHGDHGAVAELQTLRAAVREVAPLFGVRVEKWLGDGLMLVGVESEPLVGAALAIEQRHHRTGQLELRGGVASGDVILLEGDDYVGRAVNLGVAAVRHRRARLAARGHRRPRAARVGRGGGASRPSR